MDQEVSGGKLFLVALGKVEWHGLVGYEQSWSCGENAEDLIVWVGRASAVFDLVRNVTRDDSLW